MLVDLHAKIRRVVRTGFIGFKFILVTGTRRRSPIILELTMQRNRFVVFLFLSLCLRAQDGKAALEKSVAPFLGKHCSGCHNARVKMGDVNLEQLRDLSKGLAERNLWDDVLAKLRSGEMPPPGRPRPTASEMKSVTGWIDRKSVV